MHGAGREVIGTGIGARSAECVRTARLSREPGGPHDVPGEQPEVRQHDGPADPVTERRHGSDERRVFPPALVGVDRHPARLVREHRGELRVEDDDRDDDERRQPPDQRRPPTAHVEHGPPERAQHEARTRETDDESVVPAERFQELSLFDDRHADGCITGRCLSHAYLPLRPQSVASGRAATVTPGRWSFNVPRDPPRKGRRTIGRNGRSPDHDHVRMR